MPISIDNLINVNFIKGDLDLLKFGLMLGGKGQHKPYINPFVTQWRLEDADKTIALPLPSAGTYDFVVDWGDGTTGIVTAYNDADISHTYTTAGIKTVSIKGKMTHWSFNNGGDKLKITDVLSGGSTGLASLYGGFYGCSNLKFVANDSEWTKDVTDMAYMFGRCYVFNSDISAWDVSDVKDMYYMFGRCYVFNSDISAWDVSDVTDMALMFYECSVFNSDISAWDVSDVTDMGYMFYHCSVFNSDISAWDVSSVTNMSNMLNGANAFSTANYDLLLNAWSSLTLKPNVHFHAGDAKYTIATSQSAHDILSTTPNSWTIYDGGGLQ